MRDLVVLHDPAEIAAHYLGLWQVNLVRQVGPGGALPALAGTLVLLAGLLRVAVALARRMRCA